MLPLGYQCQISPTARMVSKISLLATVRLFLMSLGCLKHMPFLRFIFHPHILKRTQVFLELNSKLSSDPSTKQANDANEGTPSKINDFQ